jgi:RNA polymerase sigma-70 factor (ECF subfamily)
MRVSIDHSWELLGCEQQASVAAAISDADFRRVVLENGPYVWRVLRSLGVAQDDLPDVSQETFITVHRKWSSFEGRSSLRSWIYGVAMRVASDHRKRLRTKRERAQELPELPVAAGQHDALERAQAWRLLDGLLDALDDDLRRVFVLYELEQLPMREIAEAVGCPLSTAYWRLNTARDIVQARLAEQRAREGAP